MTRFLGLPTIVLSCLLMSSIFSGSAAAQAPTPSDEKYPFGLPAGMTPEEERMPLPTPQRGLPPTGVIHCPAEYEPCQGLLMSWMSFTSLLSEMAVPITQSDPPASVWMVVNNATTENTAFNSLRSAGANMSRVRFLKYTTDSVWMRDYGPRFIFDDGARAMIDHVYNRPRPLDDAFPDFLSPLWGESQFDIPLTHGGGNFHLFTNGDAFMSSLIQDENPGYTAQQIKNLYSQYQNVDVTIYTGFPTNFDSTRHIDMWMLPLTDNKIIIGQYAVSTGQPYTITEGAVADLTARGYTVYRTPGWNSGGTHYTYTNAVIMNNLVFVLKFNVAQDATALAVFQNALPGKTFQQIDCSSIIGLAGALHCIVMHVPAYVTTLKVTPTEGLSGTGPEGGPFTPSSIVYTLENTGAAPIDYSVTTNAAWLSLLNEAGTINSHGTVQVTVSLTSDANALAIGRYDATVSFTNLTDHNGDTSRPVALAVGTSMTAYSFPMDTNPGWTVQGLWTFGHPLGYGSDPANGHTGSNVYGYNIVGTGQYTNSMPKYCLTTTALDCSNLANVQLKFWRWLGIEDSQYDRATIEVSSNGTTWRTVWAHNGGTTVETGWSQYVYDLSATADRQSTVYVRWGLGPTDSSGTYCGWNIDDVEIWGIQLDPCVPLSYTVGDVNADSAVDGLDVQTFVSILLNPADPWTQAQKCAADCNGDHEVDLNDVGPFITLLLGQ